MPTNHKIKPANQVKFLINCKASSLKMNGFPRILRHLRKAFNMKERDQGKQRGRGGAVITPKEHIL